MRQKTIIYISLLFVTLLPFMVSCEKDISVELPRPETKLVVQGFIELDEYPVVFLTKNSAYFDIVDTTFVQNLIISDDQAKVIVSYNSQVDTLVPHTFDIWPYKGYIGTRFRGQIHGRYDLKILYNNNEYFSTTTIRDTIAIDSVWYTKPFGMDTLGYLSMEWRNPPGFGDYFTIRLKTSSQKWFFRSSMIHVLDDKLLETNEKIICPGITKGFERNSYFPKNNEDIDWLDLYLFKKGDTISLKLSTIDEAAYLFWSSWDRNSLTDGNPFTNPASVKSNIQGSPANGYWIGYGSNIKTIYIDDEYNVVPIP